MRYNNKGFTLIELVLVITILGILAVMALPQFINVSTQASQSARDGVVGSVRAGVALQRANDLVVNGPPGIYPAFLDGVAAADGDGAAGGANPVFRNVLQQGVTDNSWTKAGLTYAHTDGTTVCTYTYVPGTGAFTGAPAASCP